MLEAPLLSPESWKGNIMDEDIFNNDIEEFTPPGRKFTRVLRSQVRKI
jgi:hypothetical protein